MVTPRPKTTPRSSGAGATIYSVAERAGVSIATVSRVLSGAAPTSPATVEKVLTAVRQLNYVPHNAARSLALRRSQAHGMIIGSMAGPYWSDMIMGYEEAVAARGQSMLLRVYDPSRPAEQDLFDMRGRVDAVVINHPWLDGAAISEFGRKLPVAVVGREDVTDCDVVISESRELAERLTRHLLVDHGRRQLIFVGDPDAAGDVRDRYAGFCAAQDLIDVTIIGAPLRVTYTEDSGHGVVSEILEHVPKVDGVVCANDELALAVMNGLRRAGVEVGREIAVTGWDDVTTARYVTPGLTTVYQPIRQLGSLAAEVLHARLADPARPTARHLLASELRLRQSCGCP